MTHRQLPVLLSLPARGVIPANFRGLQLSQWLRQQPHEAVSTDDEWWSIGSRPSYDSGHSASRQRFLISSAPMIGWTPSHPQQWNLFHSTLYLPTNIDLFQCPAIHGRRSINWSGPTVLMFCRTAFPRVPRHAGEETKKCKHPVAAFLGRRHHPILLSSSLPQMLSLCPVFLSCIILGYCFFKLSLPFSHNF